MPEEPSISEVAEPVTPTVLQQFSILSIKKKVKRGDVFVFRLLLEQENDILVVSQIDKAFFQSVSIENLFGEVIFTFRALKVGVSEIVIDSVSDHLQHPYVKYEIIVEPSSIDLAKKKEKADNSLREKNEIEARKKKVEAFIAQGLVKKAQKELDDLLSRFPSAVGVNDLVEKIIKSMKKAGKSKNSLDFVEKLIKNQSNEDVLMMLRLHFFSLLRQQGKNTQASEELLKVLEQKNKVKSGSQRALYVAKAFYLLGDSLFSSKNYALARNRYLSFVQFFSDYLTPVQQKMLSEEHFVAHFRLAESFEHDAQHRDYQKAFEYYGRVVMLVDEAHHHDDQQNNAEIWKKKAKTRQIFLKEHFLDIR